MEEAPGGASGVIARVTGKDTIGLLTEILRRFEASALRLREFSIRTVDDEIDDWFWLQRVEPPADSSSSRSSRRNTAVDGRFGMGPSKIPELDSDPVRRDR